MEIKIPPKAEQGKYYDEIFEMLTLADDEFVPPLSLRSSTVQTDLKNTKKVGNGILSYFEELKKQRIMIAEEGGKTVAFVAFRENFTNEKITGEHLPNIYISTLIVRPEGRGMGLTQKMYQALFSEYKKSYVFTRTWSTNMAHIKILSKFDFETMCVLENDRGEGIDTVYFKKSPEAEEVK